jgi:hypothetical protein
MKHFIISTIFSLFVLSCSNEGNFTIPDSGMFPRDSSVSQYDSQTDSSSTSSDANCAIVELRGQPYVPTVLFVVDKSGSMEDGFGSYTQRWDAVRDALTGPYGVVTSLENHVRFGVMTYNRTSMCPAVSLVQPQLANRAAIDASLSSQMPYGDTPTGPALNYVVNNASTIFATPAPHFVILVTDGYPDTCEDGNDEIAGREMSVSAVRALRERSISTFVLSVGDDIGEMHLRDVANAGAPTPPGMFFMADSPSRLSAALGAFLQMTQTCHISLNGSIEERDICNGEVTIDGSILSCNSDYRWIDNRTIEILGSACSRIKDGGQLIARFPCSVVLI